jgi:hypothetical protein
MKKVNEENVVWAVRKLKDSLLRSEYGVDEDSYSILHELVWYTEGPGAAIDMDSLTESTDGYFYYPEGNLVDVDVSDIPEQVAVVYGGSVATMNDVLDALDARIEFEIEDDEPEVDLYDDLAD